MKTSSLFAAMLLLAASALHAQQETHPSGMKPLTEWSFANSDAGWGDDQHCQLTVDREGLMVRSTEEDPYFFSPNFSQNGPVWAHLRMKAKSARVCQIFWLTTKSPKITEASSVVWTSISDGQWHDYVVFIPESGELTRLRFDPGENDVDVQLSGLRLYAAPPGSAEGVNLGGAASSKWTFHESLAGWRQMVQCEPRAEKDALKLRVVGKDPSMCSPSIQMTGPVTVRLRMKTNLPGKGQIFWMTMQAPRLNEAMSAVFDLICDGQWHDYEVKLPAQGVVMGLRFDPGQGSGEAQIEWIEAQGSASSTGDR